MCPGDSNLEGVRSLLSSAAPPSPDGPADGLRAPGEISCPMEGWALTAAPRHDRDRLTSPNNPARHRSLAFYTAWVEYGGSCTASANLIFQRPEQRLEGTPRVLFGIRGSDVFLPQLPDRIKVSV